MTTIESPAKSATIETVLNETRVFHPPEALVRQANISGMAAYEAMCAEAASDFEGFWAKQARNELRWTKPFTQTLDESNAPFFKWFADGELNASENCLERHLRTQPNKVAIIFEADDGTVTKVTYKELYHRVCQFANGLKKLGIQKGDRVLVYLPMSIEAVVAMAEEGDMILTLGAGNVSQLGAQIVEALSARQRFHIRFRLRH